jgi:cobalt/nickel transport system permease protein
MPNIHHSIDNMGLLEDLARQDTLIHRRHPLVKLLTALMFIAAAVSFGRYEVSRLLPFALYPIVLMAMAEIPAGPILKRLLAVSPLVLGIGFLNPWFDRQTMVVGSLAISAGWLSFGAILIKGALTVTASLLLIATTGMRPLAAALRLLRVPKLLVLQLLLTYRYIAVLMEEVSRMLRAYALRAPDQNGIHRSAWGSFAGQLLMRTFDRAQRVYQAMKLRGFDGEYSLEHIGRFNAGDGAYLAGWGLFIWTARFIDLPRLLETLLMGGIR